MENRKLLQIILARPAGVARPAQQPAPAPASPAHHGALSPQSADAPEVAQYIQHRLGLAGAKGRPAFTKPAVWRICNYSGGIPRLVNAVCDKALLAGFVEHSDRITYRMVGRAIRELEGNIHL